MFLRLPCYAKQHRDMDMESPMHEDPRLWWSLDGKLIGLQVLGPLITWGVLVGGAAYAGYPGAACVTPMAWLLGCRVGLRCVQRSHSAPRQRIVEAVVAGALLGLLQGLIFYILQRALMPVRPDEEHQAFVLSAIIIVGGMLVTAFLALVTAVITMRRLLS